MRIWVTSDTHFCHANILTFTRTDGRPLRPFAHVREMDECLIANWNDVVQPADHVYHLGDVTMLRGAARQQVEPILSRLHGHKRLLLGNHDLNEVEWYARWFKKIMSYRVFDHTLLSHIPIHAESMGRFRGNLHGHTHANLVMASPHHPDPRYVNACVEQTHYAPVLLDALLARLPARP